VGIRPKKVFRYLNAKGRWKAFPALLDGPLTLVSSVRTGKTREAAMFEMLGVPAPGFYDER
jgi:hypothetical protein